MNENSIIPSGEPLPGEYETLSREELHRRLKTYIAGMLEHNFEKLCNMMYRHDVSEHKFNKALDARDPEAQADLLADLVIERELQKMETRKAYRRDRTGGVHDTE